MAAESRKVVEDATDWAEAQPEPDPARQRVYGRATRMDDPWPTRSSATAA